MSIIVGGPVPEIGSLVRLPNGRQGTVEGIFQMPVLSWLFQTLYYRVKWSDYDRKTRIYSFQDLEVLGKKGESVW